jgi:hypothetical protein
MLSTLAKEKNDPFFYMTVAMASFLSQLLEEPFLVISSSQNKNRVRFYM